jgi:hypothetical protein
MRDAVPYPQGHDGPADNDLLAEQLDYYRHRAREYDVTAYGYLTVVC